jgi:hypothetical protein
MGNLQARANGMMSTGQAPSALAGCHSFVVNQTLQLIVCSLLQRLAWASGLCACACVYTVCVSNSVCVRKQTEDYIAQPKVPA